MDSDAIEREDRLARYVLTGLIVTVCTWALTLMGVADSFSHPVCFAASCFDPVRTVHPGGLYL